MEFQNRRVDLPTDCLVNAFCNLGLDDLTTAVPFVCKSWSRAAIDPHCWRILDLRSTDTSKSGFFKLAVNRSHGAAVELRFPLQVLPSPEILSHASDFCRGIKKLDLPRIGLEGKEHFLQMVVKWKELEVLEMESKPSILPEMVKRIGLQCPNFQGLKLRGTIEKEDAAAIAGSLPKLPWLDLSGCRLGREEVVAIMEGCRELKILRLRDCVGFEADEELKRRGRRIEVFEPEGSAMSRDDACDEEEEVDENDILTLEISVATEIGSFGDSTQKINKINKLV